HKTNHPKLPHEGYRFRGVATQPDARRKGYAKELLGAAIEHIKTQLHGDYLWCIAREIAYPIYLEMGFEFLSYEFEYKDAGKHKDMYIPFYQALIILRLLLVQKEQNHILQGPLDPINVDFRSIPRQFSNSLYPIGSAQTFYPPFPHAHHKDRSDLW